MPSVVLVSSPHSTLVTIVWYFESFTKIWRLQPYGFVRMKARMRGTMAPSSTSREGIPCTELQWSASDNPDLRFSLFVYFTKKPFSSDGGDETVQRVLVDQPPALLVCRLVHDPRLHNICRSPHDGSDQPGGNPWESWREVGSDTDPAHAEDMVCVRVLSSRLLFSRMFLFTLS